MVRTAYESSYYEDMQKEIPSITAITCCDPFCNIKMGYQLNDIFDAFGFKGIGPATCHKVVRYYREKRSSFTIADILINGVDGTGLFGAEYSNWLNAMELMKNSKQTLGALIVKLCYPGLGTKFEDIFQGYSSLEEFATSAQDKGLFQLFRDKSVLSENTYYYFCIYFKDIVRIVEYLENTIIMSCEKICGICLTGKMSLDDRGLTKSEFLRLCNEVQRDGPYSGLFEIKSVESVPKSFFVIAGANSVSSKTNKYKLALTKQSNSTTKVLYSPEEFIEFLRKGC